MEKLSYPNYPLVDLRVAWSTKTFPKVNFQKKRRRRTVQKLGEKWKEASFLEQEKSIYSLLLDVQDEIRVVVTLRHSF